jgi:flagellin-like protein
MPYVTMVTTYYRKELQRTVMEYDHFLTPKRIIALVGGVKKEPQLIEQSSIKTATMSNTTFNRKNRTKKGISPVIATVILVAVAVVIAAALAGFASSLFGTYSSAGAAVTVRSITMDVTGQGTVSLVNSGNVADELVSISIVGFTPVAPTNLADDFTVEPNGDPMEAEFDIAPVEDFDEGQVVTVKLMLKSGAQLTQSTIVTE